MSKTQNIQVILRPRPTAVKSEHINVNTLDKTIEIEYGDTDEITSSKRKKSFKFNGVHFIIFPFLIYFVCTSHL